MFTFNAIDVETANADRSSICSIGVAHVRDGYIQDTWKSLIDPEDWFDYWNVEIHGITEDNVEGAPTLPDVWEELSRRLHGSIVVSHTSFDRVAFERASAKYALSQLDARWLNSAQVVRRSWPDQYAHSGYGLESVAHDLGIPFQHHDALEDAKAAAQVVLRACTDTGMDLEAWFERVKRPIMPSNRKPPKSVGREGNPDGPLAGEAVVFTGILGITRQEAAGRAAQAGCAVLSNVTKHTTILVVGLQDRDRLKGYEKSSKHRKTEQLIADGKDIQILSEDDFWAVTQ